jgi:hypothetical protein
MIDRSSIERRSDVMIGGHVYRSVITIELGENRVLSVTLFAGSTPFPNVNPPEYG